MSKAALLIALYFTGLTPNSRVGVRIVEKMGAPGPFAGRFVTLFHVDEEGHCTPIPMANPAMTDSSGRLAFCAEKGRLGLLVEAEHPKAPSPKP